MKCDERLVTLHVWCVRWGEFDNDAIGRDWWSCHDTGREIGVHWKESCRGQQENTRQHRTVTKSERAVSYTAASSRLQSIRLQCAR